MKKMSLFEFKKKHGNNNVDIDWLKCQRFFDILLQLKLELKNKSIIKSNEYDKYVFGNVLHEEFTKIFELLLKTNKDKIIDESNNFESSYLLYDGIIFHSIIGQGSTHMAYWPEYQEEQVKKALELVKNFFGEVNLIIDTNSIYDDYPSYDEFILNFYIKDENYCNFDDSLFWEKVVNNFSSSFFNKYTIVLNPMNLNTYDT